MNPARLRLGFQSLVNAPAHALDFVLGWRGRGVEDGKGVGVSGGVSAVAVPSRDNLVHLSRNPCPPISLCN